MPRVHSKVVCSVRTHPPAPTMPYTFWGPSGHPPWSVEASQLPSKRCRHATAPPLSPVCRFGSCASTQTPGLATRSHSCPSLPSGQRSFASMVNATDLHHTILSELAQHSRGHTSLHKFLDLEWQAAPNSRVRAPPPQQIVHILRQKAVAGDNVSEILDAVSRTRAAYSIRDTSYGSYISHLRSICAVCDILKEQVVPAKLQTIRRYTAICNNAVTLRWHLAALRLLHVIFGEV